MQSRPFCCMAERHGWGVGLEPWTGKRTFTLPNGAKVIEVSKEWARGDQQPVPAVLLTVPDSERPLWS